MDSPRPPTNDKYDKADRLIRTEDAAGNPLVNYTFDDLGNTTSSVGTTITGEALNTTFAYHQANRLTQAVVGGTGGTTSTYAYNVSIATGAVEVYHQDHLGSVRELTDADGHMTTICLTDEYGAPSTLQGTDGTHATASDQPFWFTGELFDGGPKRPGEPNLLYLRARYYDPGTGRFLTSDPLAPNVSAVSTLHRSTLMRRQAPRPRMAGGSGNGAAPWRVATIARWAGSVGSSGPCGSRPPACSGPAWSRPPVGEGAPSWRPARCSSVQSLSCSAALSPSRSPSAGCAAWAAAPTSRCSASRSRSSRERDSCSPRWDSSDRCVASSQSGHNRSAHPSANARRQSQNDAFWRDGCRRGVW
ncbi:MAG TPA: hypothetical protein VFN74_00190 [Chloroflexota bacterium]|nr:hypothetical protein [Chloroflexota bacterium]